MLRIGSNNVIWVQLNPCSDLSGKSLSMAKEQNFQIQKELALWCSQCLQRICGTKRVFLSSFYIPSSRSGNYEWLSYFCISHTTTAFNDSALCKPGGESLGYFMTLLLLKVWERSTKLKIQGVLQVNHQAMWKIINPMLQPRTGWLATREFIHQVLLLDWRRTKPQEMTKGFV